MLLKSPGKVLEKSLNKRLSNLYEPCSNLNFKVSAHNKEIIHAI